MYVMVREWETKTKFAAHKHKHSQCTGLNCEYIQGFPFQMKAVHNLLAILDLKITIIYYLQTINLVFWYFVHFNYTIIFFENTLQMRHGLF